MGTIICKECGSILLDTGAGKNRVPCSTCGSMERIIPAEARAGVNFSEGLGLKQKRPGFKRSIHEEISGNDIRQRDGKVLYKQRIIDRLYNRYVERIIDKKTGKVIHECDEPLSKHKGHGSARKQDPTSSCCSLESGLLWVENRIRELSQELGRPVDCLEWLRSIDVRAEKIPLKIWRGGEFWIIEFRRKELVMVEGDPEMQQRLKERMRKEVERKCGL